MGKAFRDAIGGFLMKEGPKQQTKVVHAHAQYIPKKAILLQPACRQWGYKPRTLQAPLQADPRGWRTVRRPTPHLTAPPPAAVWALPP